MVNDNNDILLFAYGTLLDRKVCHNLFGAQPAWVAKARLYGWQKNTSEKYPYLITSENSFVEGVILRLVPSQLEIADNWEEVPEVYYRTQLVVETENQQKVKVWIYLKSQK